jgi:cysteine desulfuration protein SufE
MIDINQKKEKVLADLRDIQSTEDRYKFIIEMGRKLPALTDDQRSEKFLIQGCMSRAWLIPESVDGKLYFHVDSEAAIVKGIMAILAAVYSGNKPEENLTLPPDFLKEGGITEHLSMNRRSGLSSVVKQMMLYSMVFKNLSVKSN